jgi:hypothetical protein
MIACSVTLQIHLKLDYKGPFYTGVHRVSMAVICSVLPYKSIYMIMNFMKFEMALQLLLRNSNVKFHQIVLWFWSRNMWTGKLTHTVSPLCIQFMCIMQRIHEKQMNKNIY